MPGFHHSVAVLPLPFHRCCFHTPLLLPLRISYVLVRQHHWPGTVWNNGKIELELLLLNFISTEEQLVSFLPFTAVMERNLLT